MCWPYHFKTRCTSGLWISSLSSQHFKKKRHFYQRLGNSPSANDCSVHFARQIKGRCYAASVAALFLEDMQTFPQSANGNRLFPDNRAPSWEILSCESNSSLLALLQDEAAAAPSRKQMSAHIYPKIKRPAHLQKQTRRGRVLVWEMHLGEDGLFQTGLFVFLLQNGGQCREMTSQLDLHFTTDLFERIVSALCQFLYWLRPLAQRPRGSEVEQWADFSSF